MMLHNLLNYDKSSKQRSQAQEYEFLMQRQQAQILGLLNSSTLTIFEFMFELSLNA